MHTAYIILDFLVLGLLIEPLVMAISDCKVSRIYQ
jgi:hypothetical protein